MNITPKPIPAHKLPPVQGTDPAYLQSLKSKAIEQYLLAQGDDGQLPYFIYIKECDRLIEKVTAC